MPEFASQETYQRPSGAARLSSLASVYLSPATVSDDGLIAWNKHLVHTAKAGFERRLRRNDGVVLTEHDSVQ